MYIGPHKPGTRFYRGNLHGHSNHSDGAKTPREVVEFYQELGYDFICISDHLWRNSRFAAVKACWTLVICATKTSQP